MSQNTSSKEFPVLFNINGSARHEVLLIDPEISLNVLHNQMLSAIDGSPNCTEPMAKYKKSSGGKQKIEEVKVRWANHDGRDMRVWPQTTIITDDNSDAVLSLMMQAGTGRDVLEIKIAQPQEKE